MSVFSSLNSVSIAGLGRQVSLALKGPTTLIVSGPGGCGKTQIIKQICRQSGRPYVYINAATRTVESVGGFVMPTGDATCGQVVPRFWFDLPEDTIIHLDELDKTAHRDQSMYLEIVDTKSIDGKPIPKGCQFIITANRSVDRGGSNGLNPLFGNRSRAVEFLPDPTEVLEYFRSEGVHYYITTYLLENPGDTNDYRPDRLINNTSRSWMNLSHDLHVLGDDAPIRDVQVLVASYVPQEVAQRMVIYAEMRGKLVPYEDVLRDPTKAKLPGKDGGKDTRALRWLQISMVASRASSEAKNRGKAKLAVWKYAERFNPEFKAAVFPMMFGGGNLPAEAIDNPAVYKEIMAWKTERERILATGK